MPKSRSECHETARISARHGGFLADTNYTGGGFEIEHIFPQNPSLEATAEFGPFEDTNVAGRLGNLVLVEGSINAALGNRPYSEKRPVYPQSQLLLTRALAERPNVGTNTRIDIAVSALDPFAEWNETAVIGRQDMLATLARSVWGVRQIPQVEQDEAARRDADGR